MVLSAGQVILVFFVVAAFFSTAMFIFLCELVHKRVKQYQTEKKMKIEESRKRSRKYKKKDRLPKDLLRYPIVVIPPDEASKWREFFQEDLKTIQPSKEE